MTLYSYKGRSATGELVSGRMDGDTADAVASRLPHLRRILMWDEFEDHPMRKDYVEPDDYEYEPTPHDDVLAKAKQHTA